MVTQLEPIAAILKAARERKGLSQLALGQRVGLPQSHISKIENAAVDLQTSSLIEIARALDLELTLLPRSALAAIQALQLRRSPEAGNGLVDRHLIRLAKHAKMLQRRFPQAKVFERLNKTTDELRRLRYGVLAANRVHQLVGPINDALERLRRQRNTTSKNQTEVLLEVIASRTEELRRLRNDLAHGLTEQASTPLPAYRLDKDGEGDG